MKTPKFNSVGFTGTRHGMTHGQKRVIEELLREWQPQEVHSGDCLGADSRFHFMAYDIHVNSIGHPPDDHKHRAFCKYCYEWRPKPYLLRNQDIVYCCDVLLACPHGMAEEQRSGTWATVRYARKAGKPVIIVWPDGTATKENYGKSS